MNGSRRKAIFLIVLVLASACCTAAIASQPPNATGPLAHRGLCLEAPENTLAAFRMALDAGFGFELDVWASKDGHAVVIHDATLQRTTDGHGKVSEKTLSELKSLDAGSWFDEKFREERIPTLEEALRLVAEHARKDLTVALHMKEFEPELLEKTVRLVAAHGLLERTFAFGQPPDATRRMKRFDPRIRTVLADFADPRDFQKREIWSQVTSESECDGLWIHFVPTFEQMREARAKEVPIYLYTPSSKANDWRRGHQAGVVFCSNHVKALTRVIGDNR